MIQMLRALFAPRTVRSADEVEAERRADERRAAAAQQERQRQVAAQARAEREREEAEREAEMRRQSAEEIERACRVSGFWFPGDVYSMPESRLSGRSWRSRLAERLFGGWR